MQPLLFLTRSLCLQELTPTSPKLGPRGSHPASDNAPRSSNLLKTTNATPPPGTKSKTLPHIPSLHLQGPHRTSTMLNSTPKLGPRPTSSALSRESGKRTHFRLSFPHRSLLPLLRTWPCPKIPRKPPSPGPPLRPSPGSSPPEVTQNPQSLTGQALCQPLSPVPAGALQRMEGASRTAQEAQRVPPPARGGYAPSSRQSCCCRLYP